jgi:hypothetical protein
VAKDAKVRKTAARHEKKIRPPSKDEIRRLRHGARSSSPQFSADYEQAN